MSIDAPRMSVTVVEDWEMDVGGHVFRSGSCHGRANCTEFRYYVTGARKGRSWYATTKGMNGLPLANAFGTGAGSVSGPPSHLQCDGPGEFLYLGSGDRGVLLCEWKMPLRWDATQDALACVVESRRLHELCERTPCTFSVVPGATTFIGKSRTRHIQGSVLVSTPVHLRGRRGSKAANGIAAFGLTVGALGTLVGLPVLLVTDPSDGGLHDIGVGLTVAGGVGLVGGLLIAPLGNGEWERR